MLTLKGSLLGLAIFAVESIVWVIYLLYALTRTVPHPAGTQLGVDIRVFAQYTVSNPLW
jgi:hypothetical protein